MTSAAFHAGQLRFVARARHAVSCRRPLLSGWAFIVAAGLFVLMVGGVFAAAVSLVLTERRAA